MACSNVLHPSYNEVCLMRHEQPNPPGGYQHFDLAHFCVEELLYGDPNCRGVGTSVSPRKGSIRGVGNQI